MNELEKAYEGIERWHLYSEQEGFVSEEEISYLDYIKKHIDNLQSKIDKANEYLESHFIFDDENGEYYQTHTFDKDNAKELHEILKEDK